MAFKIEQNKMGMKGDFAISLTEPVVLQEERKNILEIIVEQINIVRCTIIAGMKIAVFDYGMQMTDSGKKGYKIELLSVR